MSPLFHVNDSIIITEFIKNQADLKLIDFKGRNFFHYPNHLERSYLKMYSQYLSKEKILEMLNQEDSEGKTPLQIFIQNNKDKVEKFGRNFARRKYDELVKEIFALPAL